MGLPIIKMATIGLLPSPLKVLFYKMKGARIGKNVSIGLLSVINADEIEMGDDCKIGPISFITARKFCIGKRVKINAMVAIETVDINIDNDSIIMEQVVIGGMMTSRSKINIGKRVKIFPYSFLNPTEPITIEDDAGIGGANYIFTHGSWQNVLDGFPVSFGPVHIKKGVWFPWRVFVMPNVTVGEYATIGAGSIITKDIPSYSLAAGSPAKVLRSGNEYIKQYSVQEKNEMIIKILEEFVDFQNFKGKKYSIEKTIELNSCTIKNKGETILFYHQEIKNISDAQVLVSLFPMSEELKTTLHSKNKIWFDIGGKNTFLHKSKLWIEVKDFFSRWGIRFEIES